jgi:hypothetical protein
MKTKSKLTKEQLEVREEFEDGLTRNQMERYTAAIIDGKSPNVLPKYVSTVSKNMAGAMSTPELLDYLAINWKSNY